MIRPTFRDAYLVTLPPAGGLPLGVVRRDVHVWRIFLFGVAPDGQPRDVFETREAAGVRVIELAQREP